MARIKKSTDADNRSIAVYVRKSKITETGKSIEIQKEKCIALINARFDSAESEILTYSDEGKSGFYADRPMYKQMLKDIEDNKIKAVVCYKIDRISRRTIDLLNLVQQMEQKGIAFISVSDKELDTSSRTGKIMIALLSAIAEFERDIIAERIMDNMYELAKEGRWLGGTCPLGYFSKKEQLFVGGKKTTINHLEAVENEQLIVKKIFEAFLQNHSLTKTATLLNNEGLHTHKKKRFTPIAVKNILQNPVYAIADNHMRDYFSSHGVQVWADENDFDGVRGIMAFNKTEQFKEIGQNSRALDPKYTQKILRRDIKKWIVSVGKHHGIIIGENWILVQSIISEIAHNHTARPKVVSRALLSGILSCSVCGNRMIVRPESGRFTADGSRKFRYVCEKKVYEKDTCKNSPNVRGNEIDAYVFSQILNIKPDIKILQKEIQNTKDTFQFKSNELQLLKKRLLQINDALQIQAQNLRSAPESIRDIIYSDLQSLTSELNSIKQRIKTICKMDKSNIEFLNLPEILENIDYETKLHLIRSVLNCVVVDNSIVHVYSI
ncbi:MAG: recombinase family protein [Defluviitaleaceae bacterium]|nr:recombinase family protein [Defluviitaleaceae bacterium]